MQLHKRCGRTWGGNDDVRVAGQLGELGLHGVASHQHGCAQGQEPAAPPPLQPLSRCLEL